MGGLARLEFSPTTCCDHHSSDEEPVLWELHRYNSMLKVISVGSIALPLFLSQMEQFVPGEESSLAGPNATGATCATMSAAQLAGMEAVRFANTTSCTYKFNISIGPAGVIVH